ncbi:hypothetical protein [Agrobacterium sp. lyk4-40-TYG-31]|uniref:hypothetical protein n=1 Tax=Agrobacterium sp. lyk4-40-TYG-31 TaxID=3040276 RepID=UPI00254EBC2C|nr:hypothetical protein [Agrobacterium sp. lyk4-40-TYG-31]
MFEWVIRRSNPSAEFELVSADKPLHVYGTYYVAELEVAHAVIEAAAARDLETVKEILSAPDEEDGPVSPLLEKLRAKRFGGRT